MSRPLFLLYTLSVIISELPFIIDFCANFSLYPGINCISKERDLDKYAYKSAGKNFSAFCANSKPRHKGGGIRLSLPSSSLQIDLFENVL